MTMPAPTPLEKPEPWDLVADAYAVEAVPAVFAHFAEAALRLADLPPAARVVDVACGPGTLALAAAPRAAHVAQTIHVPSTAELWATSERTNAPMALARRQLGDRWPEVATRALAHLEAALGAGPQEVTMRALLAVGEKA